MKITKARVREIIKEEYQKLKENPEIDSEESLKAKSELVNKLKSDYVAAARAARISTTEVPLFWEILSLVLEIFDVKSIDQSKAEKIEKLMRTVTATRAK